MTTLLRDLALDKEDFSSEQEELNAPNQKEHEEKYNTLMSSNEELRLAHHKTLGEVSILKDTLSALQDDYKEAKKHIDRQKERESEFQEVEANNVDLLEECERYMLALKELQSCHSDLEQTLSDSSDQVCSLQMEKKSFQAALALKDDTIAKLEKELCDADSTRSTRTAPEVPPSGRQSSISSLGTFASDDSATAGGVEVNVKAHVDVEGTAESVPDSNELSLPEQVEDLKECARRSSSRLAYLNTRLAAKESSIQKLQNRIEEVTSERDSFREALQMSFVSPERGITAPCAHGSVARSSSESALSSTVCLPTTGLDSSPLDDCIGGSGSESESVSDATQQDTGKVKSKSLVEEDTKTDSSLPDSLSPHTPPNALAGQPAGTSGGVLGNWQSTMAVATGLTTDGLKGVTSSLGSYLYAPSSSGGPPDMPGMSSQYNQHIAHLEKKVRSLLEKNNKMEELRSLIPVVEDLKEKVRLAEEASQETDKWADEEFGVLSAKLDEMRLLRKEAVANFHHSQQEVDELKQQIARTANTYSKFEEKLEEKARRILIVEKELRKIKENSVDITTHEEVQERIHVLMGESKHWQQKAQSLSKEMHRSMSVQVDNNKKKEEILRLQKKVEELEVERLSFKEAMQEAMLDQMNLEQAGHGVNEEQLKQHERPSATSAGALAKSWLGNYI